MISGSAWRMDAPDSDLDMAMEDPDLEAAMGFPVTASLGPVGPLLRQLRELTTVQNVVSGDEIQGLTEHLHGLCVSLMHHSEAEAEAEEPLNSTAKCWMREVRELCYDTKNYLDDAPFISKQDDDHGLTPQEKQENAQFEFEMLVARAKNASRRRQRYEIDHKSTSKTTKLPSTTGRGLPVLHPELIDRVRMDELARMLGNAEGEQLKVVSLVGVEGVGKTTLAKRIYHQIKTGGQFQCRAFVRVSPNPDMRGLLTSIFTQIQLPAFPSSDDEGVTQPASCLDAQDLITNIQDYLRHKRYLIIIDDLWSTSVWDIIRRAFPDSDCHSRIITTTQFEDVASACCSYQSKYKFEMEPLKYDQSRKLFFGMVFGSEDEVSFPEGFGEVSSEIIKKCDGLPLSMVNIASLLPTEESKINLQRWKDIRDSLPPTLKTNPVSKGMEKVINLIYNNLSPEVKTCLLHLAMYPEGYTSNKDDLVKQWVTEGFTGEGQNNEEIARDYFDELVSRGMIQAVDINYRGVQSCTLHHMVHDLIVKKSMEGNFIVGVDNFQSAILLPNKVHRLSVQFSGARSARIPAGITLSKVRSLAFFGFCGCADFIEECKLLRVLILHMWADQDKVPFDLSGISKILPLRYVKIACNIAVKLPAEIQDLQYLETLEVDTPVVAIPSGIGGLSRLSSLKIAVRALLRKEICILRALPALTALSLHMWTTPVEMIVFDKGEFLVLKSFEFRCPVPWLKFEAGSMPDLRNLNLCFNAHEADRHGIMPIGMEHLSCLEEIAVHIWGKDTDVVSKFRTAISNHSSNPRIDVQLVDPIFHGDTVTSVRTRAKEHMPEDEDKVEDMKKQAADSSLSTVPLSKKMSTLPGSSSHVPVQGATKKPKLETETDSIGVKAETSIYGPVDMAHRMSTLKMGIDSIDEKKQAAVSRAPTLLGPSSHVPMQVPKMWAESILERIINGDEEPKDLPLTLLQCITKDFSEENKIGEGGFGEVYKGELQNGFIVAVKRIEVNQITIDDMSFRREFSSLMNTNHQNVVRFLGFCCNTHHIARKEAAEIKLVSVRERLLCFEYIRNGSLDKHITDELRGLEWEPRYAIISGICKGLFYLHKEKHIVHMDLKPSNILLDDHMVPKITDFGLSRSNEMSHTTGQRFGTPGYVAPEYEKDGKTSFKCDIYSLGVIITELVTGRKSVHHKNNVLRRWRHRWKKPPTLLQYQQVTRCIEIAERCRQQEPEARPSIGDIISILSESESMDGHIGPESTYLDDDMLGIEPLKLKFDEEMSWSVKLTNKTKASFAFNIERPSQQYTIWPDKGIVTPGCNEYLVQITLQPQQRAPQVTQNADKIIFQSTKVPEGLRDEDITENIFHEEVGKVVDEVDLMIVYEPTKPKENCRSREDTNMPAEEVPEAKRRKIVESAFGKGKLGSSEKAEAASMETETETLKGNLLRVKQRITDGERNGLIPMEEAKDWVQRAEQAISEEADNRESFIELQSLKKLPQLD